jgi:hypothetical protein
MMPVFILIGIYLVNDPFKVLYKYPSYYISDRDNYIELDRDYVSTQNYLNNRNKYPYDSYIFGNSRSEFYPVSVFGKYVHAAYCYHFDAFGENIRGIERKMNLLDKEGATINNVFFVVDHEVFEDKDKLVGPTRTKHPALSGESMLNFQLKFFMFYFNKNFFLSYMYLLINKKVDPKIKIKVMNEINYHYIPATNELSLKSYEDSIAKNQGEFYQPRMKLFYKRDTVMKYSDPGINDEQKTLLLHISAILKTHHATCKIVINPLYDQLKLNSKDLNILYQVFGKKNVFDFSGINGITGNYTNYYENSHYRTKIAVKILDSIYSKR